MRPIFVTSNDNKRREAAHILGVNLDSADLDLPEIQALDVAEVAARKSHRRIPRPGLSRPARSWSKTPASS